jgi:hypothetical protein
MTRTRRTSTAPLLLLLPVALLLLALALWPGRAAAAQTACPGTFRVLNDDHIGKMSLPKGAYTVRVSKNLSCSYAFDLFRQFLLDYDGKLSDGWRVRAKRQTFFQPKTGDKFSVKRAKKGGGGGGHHGHSPTGAACPNLFSVLHDDRIGKLSVPKGKYQLTLLAVGRLSCDRASKLFAKFLQAYTGKLQNKWQLDVQTATFYKSLQVGFRIKQVK